MAKDQAPQTQDYRQHETLRGKGMAKEKVARTADTDRDMAARRDQSSARYEDWTKERLYGKARTVGIAGRSRMTRNELIEALRSAT